MSAVLERHAAESAAHAGRIDIDVLEDAVRIALDGGPEQQTPDWHRWASCRTSTVAELYDSGATKQGKELLRRCNEDCAVQAECLAAALGNGEREGIWGGTTKAGRVRIRNALREAGLLGVVGEDAYIAWRSDDTDREPATRPERPTIRDPWPHQLTAVQAIVDELTTGERCQIAMATASGKTHVGIWAACQLDTHLVLVLVPSLSLVTQTADLWTADPHWADTPVLLVCGDPGQSGYEATTDPARVRELAAGGRGLVFATYTSSDVLVDAQATFDLTIADEAHHLAGDPDKRYAAIVRREIPTARTLYMTATPRRYRRRAKSPDVDLVSMDDVDRFGPRVFDFTLSDAITAGVVADYKVIVAAVDRTTFDQVAQHPDLVDVDPHLLAGAIAVVEAMGQQRLTSCVSFHTKVDRARTFSRLVGDVAELLPSLAPDGPGWAGFVHGQANLNIRERLLARLADDRTWGVLANAKALGEGVDLPTLDAVAIVDPKNSETDVLQATGRALRLSGSKVGTVLLPVLLEEHADADDPMGGLDARSVDVVSGVLRALRAHDRDLGARLDHTRRQMARDGVKGANRALVRVELAQALRQQAARGLLRSRVELHLPGGALGDLAGAMALHLVREATAPWDETYARLELWTQEHGTSRIPQSDPLPASEGQSGTLGSWCSRQRTLYQRGLLQPDRAELLEALPGWTWNLREDAWWERLDALKAFVDTHGRYPLQIESWEGHRIGSFINTCRAAMTAHDGHWLLQFPDRIAALEQLPGWTWDPRDAAWEDAFDRLTRWAYEHGHAHPSNPTWVDGVNIGGWVTKQRQAMRGHGRVDGPGRDPTFLSAERAARLRALPGWVDDFHAIGEARWEHGYGRLQTYIADQGRLPPPRHVDVDGFALGQWLAKQREDHKGRRGKGGRLNPERIAGLEALPHWSWTPAADRRQHHEAV